MTEIIIFRGYKMKKIHVTRKYLKENYICCGIGYCDASYLLYYYRASFYNAGVYGWNFDAVVFGDYVITTGYRNLIYDNPVDNKLLKELNEKARILIYDNKMHYPETKEQIDRLLKEFLDKTFNADVTI